VHALPVLANDLDAVSAAVAVMVDSVNRGEMPAACAAFAEGAVIVEDIHPYRWEGPGAVESWLTTMAANAQQLGVTAISMDLGPATRVDARSGRAYAFFPAILALGLESGSLVANGQLTFTLIQNDGAWLIQTLVWTGPEPSLREL